MIGERQLAFSLPQPPPSLSRLWLPHEIYERLDKDNLEHFAEDKRLERKNAKTQPKAVAEYLSMWANTAPHGGILLLGIENNGEVTGCNRADVNHLNSLEFYGELCPDARIEIRNVAVRNSSGADDYIVAIRVYYREDKLVELSNGDAFIREGDIKRKLDETLKREIRIARGEIHYELERVLLRYPQDFDLAEIDAFCSTYQRNRRTQTKKLNVEVLELSKLGKRRDGVFQPNLACALLFANDPREVIPGARIRIIRYDGVHERFGTELNAVFSHYIDGNIPTLLRETRTVLASQLRSFQRYDSSGKLAVREEYPEEAWFEAIVNAVAHRSYNLKNQNVFVRIFDDRLVVESPGGFVAPTTSETVYDSHNPRNPYLMEAMMHLEYTFNSYEGTRRMRRAMQGARLPDPRFRQIQSLNHQVHVSLENDIATRRAEVSVETVFALPTDAMMGLNVDERTVMAVLAGAPSVNITVASLVTGKSWPTAKKLVDGLIAKGLLTPVEERRKKHDSTKSYTVPGRRVAKPN